MKIDMNKAWCLSMAEQEGTGEIGAGEIANDPTFQDEGENTLAINRLPAFGRFVKLMRGQLQISIEGLAEKTSLDTEELLSVEDNPDYQPEPRTIYQLSRVFGVPQQRLMQLAGLATSNDDALREEAVRFAARSEPMAQLTTEQRSALETFIAFLSRDPSKPAK
jgi:HTH-type transcriptional regulator, competence development regulator